MITISITLDAPEEQEGNPNILNANYMETHDTPQHLKDLGKVLMDTLQNTMLEAGARSGGIIYTKHV